jgi:hypothetical protein
MIKLSRARWAEYVAYKRTIHTKLPAEKQETWAKRENFEINFREMYGLESGALQ